MSDQNLSPDERSVLAALQAGDPDAAMRLAGLDGASRVRVIAQLDRPVANRGPALVSDEPVAPEREPARPPAEGGIDGLSPEERSVLAALQAGDPDAAMRLAGLDGASRVRVIAQLDRPVANRGPALVSDEPEGLHPELIESVRPIRRRVAGWAFALIAVVILAAAGYVLYGRLAGNDLLVGFLSDPAPASQSATVEPDPSRTSLPGATEDGPSASELSVAATTATIGADPAGGGSSEP